MTVPADQQFDLFLSPDAAVGRVGDRASVLAQSPAERDAQSIREAEEYRVKIRWFMVVVREDGIPGHEYPEERQVWVRPHPQTFLCFLSSDLLWLKARAAWALDRLRQELAAEVQQLLDESRRPGWVSLGPEFVRSALRILACLISDNLRGLGDFLDPLPISPRILCAGGQTAAYIPLA